MKIKTLDHLVLTVADIDATIEFYTRILGFEAVTFGDNRKALIFGQQKINLHQKGHEFEPKAESPTCGSADLCFIAETDIAEIMEELKQKKVDIIEGIVDRTGAVGKIKSVYFRDPDLNLIEVSNYY
ncbi:MULTISPECIES: VOC family protein [unclassified Chryseobacterium]|uniref:VOC family protein n=1 Tax=unclassified Chryseobacterium TaxID=2593645 RepID=UPI001159D898|nr:VOC family protein [Chryseobacterium sp. ON_d1]GEJ44230.1 ring-cleaving dioxygenase [Chryseobacterium sp. ON_d1]